MENSALDYFARITGVLGEEDALFIPRTGLTRFAGVERVFIVQDNVVTSRESHLGHGGRGVDRNCHRALCRRNGSCQAPFNRLADGMTVQAQAVQAQENTTVQAQ